MRLRILPVLLLSCVCLAARAEETGSLSSFPLLTGGDAVGLRWKRCFKPDLPAQDRALACRHIITDGDIDDPDLWLALADALGEMGDKDGAIDAFARAVKLDSGRTPLERRSVYFAQIGDYDRALADLKSAMLIKGPAVEVYNVSCWMHAVANRDLPQGFADCQAAIKKDPADTQALDSRGFILFRAGQMQDAVTSYSAALAVNPKLASSLYMRGISERQLGAKDAASADIAAALAIDPGIAARYQRYGVNAEAP